MHPLILLAGATFGGTWLLKRAAEKKAAELRAKVAGDSEGTVVDLGTTPLPSNNTPIDERSSRPGVPDKTFVIPRVLEILSPKQGEEVDRPGLAGKTYPVTVRWTNTLALEWRGRLVAETAEDDELPREVDLGEWVIPGGADRTAVISLSFGGGRINIGRTFVRLRLRFGDRSTVASYWVD